MNNSKFYVYLVCVCSLSYPEGKAHAPYCHMCPVWLYHIFPHYLINGTIFGKEAIEHEMFILISFTNLV